eukprot:1152050-Rhodomonas_salina.5
MSNPGPSHVIAVKRILHYLSGTKHLKLTYKWADNPLTGNCLSSSADSDSDHTGDPDTKRSVTGFVVLLNGGAVSWQSVRHQVTALSSAEAQYYAVSTAGADITYIRRLMEELGYAQTKPTPMFEDNMPASTRFGTSIPESSTYVSCARRPGITKGDRDQQAVSVAVTVAQQVTRSITRAAGVPVTPSQ